MSTPTRTMFPIESGLICYIPFFGGGGNIARDITFNKYDLTLTGDSGTGINNWVDGKIGKAIEFDGIASFGAFANSSVLDIGAGQDFSIGFWVKPISASGTHSLCNKINLGSTTAPGFAFTFNTSFFMAGRFCDGSASFINAPVNSSVNKITQNVYSHVILSYKRTANLTVYINGVSKQTTDISTQQGSLSNANILRVGRANTAIQFANMDIQHFKVWNKALSDDEALQDFLRGSHY